MSVSFGQNWSNPRVGIPLVIPPSKGSFITKKGMYIYESRDKQTSVALKIRATHIS